MFIIDHWLFYDHGNQITDTTAIELIKIMRKTAIVHADELTMNSYKVIKKRVNKAGSWMRISVGHDANHQTLVVIIYHRIKHALPNALGNPRWSISLGVIPAVTPHDRLNQTDWTDDSEPYVQLAKDVVGRVYDDAQSGRLQNNASFVVYDHVSPAGATPSDPNGGLMADHVRRSVEIGELGWVIEQLVNDDDTKWQKVEWKQIVERPKKSNGSKILGWARDKPPYDVEDAYCIRTSLNPIT